MYSAWMICKMGYAPRRHGGVKFLSAPNPPRDPVFLVRFASRCGNFCFSGAHIFGDHSVNFGFGFCASLGYPAQHARLRRPADARRLRR